MSTLSPRDRELVALGAAMGSSCVPCIEFHIPESRKAGLSDLEIHAAILHADRIRQAPARKTLQTALNLLPSAATTTGNAGESQGCGCGPQTDTGQAATENSAPPMDSMAGMMAKMMTNCGCFVQSASFPNTAEDKSATSPTTSAGCGCS